MEALLLALIVPLLAAGAAGTYLGASIVYSKREFKTSEHHLLDLGLQRRNPILNLALVVVAWALLLFVIPKASFWLVGIHDNTAFGISAGCQLAVLYISMLISERFWSRIL
jgi:hypothetical protein